MQETVWIESDNTLVYAAHCGARLVCEMDVVGGGVYPVCMEGMFARVDWDKPRLF